MNQLKAETTQEFIPIKEVRDGVIVMEDGSLRGVLLASSLNFALKSNDERESILFQFQNFLNSLDFSVQIFVQSRRLDIRPYIALLEQRQKEQVNDLLKIQTQEYIEFIRSFTENTNIMTKSFFVIIPYSPAILSSKKFLKSRKKEDRAKQETESFEQNRTQLEQRMDVVEQGLTRSGIRMARLGNEEIIELFYKLFNPGETEKPIQN